tara:strand:- start:5346 stop:6071 length:726 start_codon:yes stop_codon:yes gene_type:complete
MGHTTSKTAEITAVLRDEILRGQYRAGERLPSERDLATRFDSNRGAIREALKKLEQLGVADINPGGVRVVPVEEASLDVLGHVMDLEERPDAKLVAQIYEVFGALLSRSARTAVETASDEDLERMQEYLRAILDAANDPEHSQITWRKLGYLFAYINDNLVIRLILNGLKTQFVERISRMGLPVHMDSERATEIVKEVLDGLARRDADAVANGLTSHFELVSEAVTVALADSDTPVTAVRE